MTASKNPTGSTSTGAGVLRPDQLARHVDLLRLPCAPSLTHWVENYWMLHWDLPSGTSYRSSTLPHPAHTLSVEKGWVRDGVAALGGPVVVTGVLTRRFDVTLAATGWVLGIKFRPGGFTSLTGADARSLRDTPVSPPSSIPTATVDALAQLGPHLGADACRESADSALENLNWTTDPEYDELLGIVAAMLNDRTLIRVAQVEEHCDIRARRLQRLFAKYIGAPPKWVLARYRIHDVVTELDDGYDGSLADLAARYGWFDQAHFSREFTELIGVPPSAYGR
ncbi:MAG: helix-turn-helix transcriptional regulator [Rhodococcus sp. (in: high G+C Gram-positive bacteria)]|jgi:AraC-like DNA-binding protein|uniref:helix-turn-helix transcriptional regulator n=1 Tax=Rhodococcus sp. EPR-157 TaxID=1813677 RepID=UPI0009ED5937|nr:helix-turn-helix transcriptional regulator [Rhodococcus sp. EPR-157]